MVFSAVCEAVPFHETARRMMVEQGFSRGLSRVQSDTGSAGYFLVILAVGFCDGGWRLGVCHFHYVGWAVRFQCLFRWGDRCLRHWTGWLRHWHIGRRKSMQASPFLRDGVGSKPRAKTLH